MIDSDKPADLGPDLAAAAFDAAMAQPIPGDDAPLAPHDEPPFASLPPDDGEPVGAAPLLSADDWAVVERCAEQPQNDIGNSMRLRIRCGEDLSYAQRIGYFVWDDRRWEEDIEGKVSRPLAHRVVEAIGHEPYVLKPTPDEEAAMTAAVGLRDELEGLEAKAEKDAADKARLVTLKRLIKEADLAEARVTARRAARRRFAVTSGNSGKIEGMLKEAAPYLSRAMDEFDTEPLALNCETGTLRFRLDRVEDEESDPADPRFREAHVVELSPHRREDFITKLAPAPWEPDAPRPVFEAFMARILPKADVREFVQRYLGYCLTALTREQVFVVFHGEGRNGKSTLVDVVAKVLGDYGTTVPIATLVGDDRRKGGEATPDLVRLPGARFVRTAEPKQGMPFDESLIKALTGGEPILVRRLNQEFIEVYPTFKLVVSCNRKPEIRGDDDGIWRRVLLVPFEVQIPVEEVDKGLADKLWQERAGILAWLVEGALAYLDSGLQPPGEVRSATDEYREESDILGSFVRAALEVTRVAEDKVEAGRLYTVYENWCRLNGHTPWRAETFSRRIAKAAERHGIAKVKSSIILFTGIRVRPEFLGPAPSRTRDD
jgi:putative DNA primase/helicase